MVMSNELDPGLKRLFAETAEHPADEAFVSAVTARTSREGRIALSGVPLREAIARFNRYNDRKLVLASPELGDISTVGWFRVTDPESFARAVAISPSAQVSLSENAITISRAAKKTDRR